jgi:hypothetical protein
VRSRPSAENTNVALRLVVRASGADSMVTAGGMPSMFQMYVAGVGSTSPAASTARTANSCEPNSRSV